LQKIRKRVYKMLLQLRERNQLTIPKELIEQLGLKKDDTLNVVLEDNKLIITPVSIVETKLLEELKEAFEDIKNGKVKTFDTVEDLFKDLDA